MINKRSKQVKFVCLRLLPGTRSYECKVVGTRDTVKLSGKVLTVLEHSVSQENGQGSQKKHSESEYEVSASETDDPEGSQSAEAGVVEALVDGFSHMTGSDWKMVASFENQIVSNHPAFDVKDSGKLRRNIPKTPCDLFLTFFPKAMALIESSLPRWRAQAEQNDRRGLANLDIGMMYRFFLPCC
jgi:hypothetical protein